ncbi:hypothetical protein [Desulfobacula sp.]|uniref:hypothetical protein n=1 Tax=Desulfobacula sp. TaxID=2593537 RepID=UPI0025BC6690|nr:hypothetical protein [Desulfobacula sp.]MBC2705016.1 hypothetical protein [Desulfobacula sp.]
MIDFVTVNELKNGIKFKSLLIILLLLTFCLSGCVGLLTESQVTEIKKFSSASNSYSDYPGAVINSHADLSFHNQLTNASSSVDGKNAFGFIEKGIEKHKRLTGLEKRTDNACGILRSYSAILDKLSSDTYTADTQASLEKLGSQLDHSIQEYNEISKSSLTTFGSLIAATLRGVSSIYIKNRQHKAIKMAVTEADPAIEEIMNAITELLEMYAGENSLDIIQAEKDDLQTWYETSGYKQPLSTAIWVAEELERIESVLILVEKSKNAAVNLQKAHKILITKIEKKTDLKDTIEIIETLVEEVEAAKNFKEKLDKKNS